MRLIDADKLIKAVITSLESTDAFIKLIEEQPVIEPVRIQHTNTIDPWVLQNMGITTILNYSDDQTAAAIGRYIMDNNLVRRTSYVERTTCLNVLKYDVLVIPPKETKWLENLKTGKKEEKAI